MQTAKQVLKGLRSSKWQKAGSTEVCEIEDVRVYDSPDGFGLKVYALSKSGLDVVDMRDWHDRYEAIE